jgi:hypothetical protein
MAYGADGSLYVAGNVSDNVVRFNGSTGAFQNVFASGIDGANGLAFGPDGNLYVASEFGAKIERFSGANGGFIDSFANVAASPIGILFDVGTVPEPSTYLTAMAGFVLVGGFAASRSRAKKLVEKFWPMSGACC